MVKGKTVVVVGGSSGIGYAVAKAALVEGAGRVVIASSSQEKVKNALTRLQTDVPAAGGKIEGELSGDTINAHDSQSIRTFMEKVGQIDHLVWTSGDALRFGFKDFNVDENKGTSRQSA